MQTAPPLTGYYQHLINRLDVYLTAPHGQWLTEHQTLTRQRIADALEGHNPLGVMAVSGTGTSRFIAIDVDEESLQDNLDALARDLHPTGATLYELSRRGAHLFIFIEQAPWEQARAYGLSLTHDYGLDGVEVFPKHGGLNAIRLPGSTHPKTGERYPCLNPLTGDILDVSEVLSGAKRIQTPPLALTPTQTPKPVNPDAFDRLVEALSAHTSVKVYAPGRAIARCLWHDDKNPSLLIKDNRFHCARPDCVWGDAHDLDHWLRFGTRPPSH